MLSTMSSAHTAGDIASQSLVESSSESSPPSPCVTLDEEAVTSRCENETDFLSLSQVLDERLWQFPGESLSQAQNESMSQASNENSLETLILSEDFRLWPSVLCRDVRDISVLRGPADISDIKLSMDDNK